MSYNPNNTSVYLNAMSGAVAGMGARLCTTDASPGDFSFYAQSADAFAQQVDQAFGKTAPTAFQLQVLRDAAEETFSGYSPIPSNVAFLPGSYFMVAKGIVALMQQANTQVVSEGVNPNQGGGGTSNSTSATVQGLQTYQVLTTDAVVKMDTSNGNAAIAVLPLPAGVGEMHTFFWFAWEASQVPPVIQAGGSNKMSPATGMVQSGGPGLVTQTAMPQVGESITYKWSGSEWINM